jgi:hypothetical protein
MNLFVIAEVSIHSDKMSKSNVADVPSTFANNTEKFI